MARSHGKILVEIWHDPDWRGLQTREQWTYFMLLGQPKLSLVGCIDYWPGRWATFAEDLSAEDVEESILVLEHARKVCVDRETNELLVRSMTRHDGLRTQNPKLMKGLWGAWLAIASTDLRKVAVDNMPDALFDGDVPPEAAWMRRSERMDWSMTLNPLPEATSYRLPPSTTHRPTSTIVRTVERHEIPSQEIPPEQRQLAREALSTIPLHRTRAVVSAPVAESQK